ncbi:MAG: hypothetical protein L3J66_03795 [Bacteroidales bacterium]|nr:hypothetical protein [Bacteroidales bacterium]
MKPYPSRKTPKDSKTASISGRNDNWIFFTTILISVLFWILIKLSDQYTVPYSFHVNFTNIPVEKRMTFVADSMVNVNVTARGLDILKLNLFEDMDQLDINLDNYSLMKKEGETYFIYTEELSERLADVIGIPKTDVSFSKSTLEFRMAKLAEKKLKVINLVRLEFDDQFDLYDRPVLKPEEITVFGPAEILDTLNEVFTGNILVEQINSDRELHIRLNNPLPGLLKFEPEELVIKLRVEKFTASSIEIPIEAPGIRQTIKLFPKTVKVHFKVAQKDFNNVRTNQFEVVTDIKNIDVREAVRLPLRLAKQPAFVRNTTLDPTDVEFLIIK